MVNPQSDRSNVYLTFDDGPDPEYTPRILDILDLFQVRATFFVLGSACEQHPELVRRMVEHGHTVGNHTYEHFHPWWIHSARAREEVRRGHHAIAGVCGKAPRLFRPPYGRVRRCMVEEAAALGAETVLWNRSAVDWGFMAEIDSIARRLGRACAGDVLLCHDAPCRSNRPDLTLAVLPGFIEDCLQRRFRLVGLGERCAPVCGADSLSRLQSV
ncbi:polysaccharide deacetylase family protein [Gilvimarinus sp. F26214L]|uniref:polysaccharide deacetylase family protein n=1 Tax=Gilvimarinus sp. DZF01 TaxID=3461371 RepID=UPI00404551A4